MSNAGKDAVIDVIVDVDADKNTKKWTNQFDIIFYSTNIYLRNISD